MQEAPLYEEADGPEGGRAFWLTCADGVRVRMAWWPAEEAKGPAKGTVLFFPGRTEYVEKYGRAAREYVAAGWNMAAMDWRGQGLADRALPDPATGHVSEFDDYQRDVDAMVAAVRELEAAPLPHVMIGHSMGGCIGLRAAHRIELEAAAFSAPMWGIRFHPVVRPAAWVLSTLSRPLGMGGRFAPGTVPETYALAAEFENNMLTRDEEMWHYMRAQLLAHPELSLGGPSLHWLNRALVEMRALLRMPAPDLPCLTYLGGNERIVDPGAVHRRMASWPGAELVQPEGAEHEILMETPEVRADFFARTIKFFNTHAKAVAG
ncbi:alpha/beta fold hydrolase [Oceanicola sp. 502str15]|uniref:alpha/beta fold hydrolase n=1 Tax=Oceanicola sp. 502str15 TaxID=2696061 RepID=UPI002095D0E5|nr:alpha/beta fold hydrolase [Oceanicola sp. 502str15]